MSGLSYRMPGRIAIAQQITKSNAVSEYTRITPSGDIRIIPAGDIREVAH